MWNLVETQEPEALRTLIHACDDAWWYSLAVAQSTLDATLRQRATANAEQYQELALELVELAMPSDPMAGIGRIESLYERNLQASRAILDNPEALLGECARLEGLVLSCYRELSRAPIPRSWRPRLEAHQLQLHRALAA